MMPNRLGLSAYTLPHFFEKVIEKYGANPALAVAGQDPINYTEFGQQVVVIRDNLHQLGLKKQDKVVILGQGSPHWTIAYMAVATMGAIAVPVMDEFPDVDIEHIICHSGATAIFIDGSLYQSLNLPSLDELKIILSLDDFSVLKGELPAPGRKSRAGRKKGSASEETSLVDENDLAEILYTSGTTGHSKGVMLTHKNLVTNLIVGPEILEFIDEDSVLLGILPLAHAFGLITTLSAIYAGASIHYLDKKPSPRILLRAMQQVKPTAIGAVPLVFEKIYHRQVLPTIRKQPVLRLLSRFSLTKKLLYRIIGRKIMEAFGGRLEGVFIGGASLNHEIEIFMRAGGIPYVCGYGLSECAPIVTASSVKDSKIGSVGHAIPACSLKIEEPDPESGIGEILVKGPNVMAGYYQNEVATDQVFTPEGWLITGDRGYLDEDGFLYIKGRSKNVIIGSSGENIYPEVIEDKLKESVYVEEALVYLLDNQLVARIYPDYSYINSLESTRDENVIAANIVDILEEVRQEVNTRLPTFSRIQQVIEQQAPFIKTPTKKIKRAEYVPGYLTTTSDSFGS